jgi:uncharacterized RDD family membrane protein YckC
MTNPYAPPQAIVDDLGDPLETEVPADRGTRLGAAIVDTVIFVAMVYAPVLVTAALAQEQLENPSDAELGPILGAGFGVALVGLVVWLFFTIKYMKRNGQSIAKKMLQIKVVRADGSRVSLSRLIWLRNAVMWVLNLIPLFGVVDALFIFGESRQCLHDKIADTIVVKA